MIQPMEACGFNPLCYIGEGFNKVVGGVAGSAVEALANAVLEAVGQAVASMGTLWVYIPTPSVAGDSVAAIGEPAGAGSITTVLSYVMWIALAIALMMLIVSGAKLAVRARRGDGLIGAAGMVGMPLAAVILIAAGAGITGALLEAGPSGGSAPVAFLQGSTWWLVGAGVLLSLVVAGVRIAWEGRGAPAQALLRSLLTLVIVSGAGLTIVGLLTSAADAFSIWIINESLSCDVSSDSACFGEAVANMMGMSAGAGVFMVIILGIVALLASLLQIALMAARGGLLVVLAGTLPLTASATNTEAGRNWFQKALGWLIAFILYKPAAALIYAAAFQLTGSGFATDDGTGLMSTVSGLMLMVLSLVALPALMRFVTPMVAAATGAAAGAGAGAGAAIGAVGMMALPTGARSAAAPLPAAVGAAAAGPSVAPGGASGSGPGPAGAPGAGGAGTSGPGPAGASGTSALPAAAGASGTSALPAAAGAAGAAASGVAAAARATGAVATGAAGSVTGEGAGGAPPPPPQSGPSGSSIVDREGGI